jgi:hypothetical protein
VLCKNFVCVWGGGGGGGGGVGGRVGGYATKIAECNVSVHVVPVSMDSHFLPINGSHAFTVHVQVHVFTSPTTNSNSSCSGIPVCIAHVCKLLQSHPVFRRLCGKGLPGGEVKPYRRQSSRVSPRYNNVMVCTTIVLLVQVCMLVQCRGGDLL